MRSNRRSVSVVVWVLAVGLAFSGCTNSPTAPSDGPPLTILDLVVGTGAEAVDGKVLTVDYIGWLYDEDEEDAKGAEFDRAEGFKFALGRGQVITGWEFGLRGMRVGGTRRLIIPFNFAYGEVGQGSVPPFATLVFDVVLVEVQ